MDMESVNDGVPAPQPTSSPDENSPPSSQLSPNNENHQFSSQVDQALLTQLPPMAGNNYNHCNTQFSMPSESQCSQQMMLATQPAYNDSLLQTQLSRYNDHEDEDTARCQSSQQTLLTTQPTSKTQCYGGDMDDLSVKDDLSELNTQENSLQVEHLSMTQQQQSLLLTQQQYCNTHSTFTNGRDNEYEESSKQSHDDGKTYENNENTDDTVMSSQDQRINENGHEQVEFLYNTQQNNEQIDDDDDDDDSDNDDMERLVEEQNLAVSLSMEVIEECEESQRSREKEARYPSLFCDLNNNGTGNDDDFNEVQDRQLPMMDAGGTDPSSSRLNSSSAESGKANTVNVDEIMAKANKLLADDTQQKSSDHDYDEHDEPYNPPSTGFGFTNAGSGKSIRVDEEEVAKADKLLADDDKTISSYNMTAAAEVAVSKLTPKYQQSQLDNRSTVTNPYARKRSIDQISNAGSGKTNAAITASTPSTLAAPTPSRKLLFNPYAKTVQSTTKTVVRNPYAKVSTAAPSVVPPPSRPLQFSSTAPNNTTENVTNASSATLPTAKEETQFRFKGISFSLPIAERLPSRNVSYKPAEILTVSELHQYLYGANNATLANDFKYLQSVRITGTLLSVSSCNDEKHGSNGDLYSSGTFLLIGDPLDKNRFPAKPLPPNQQTSSSQGNVNIPRTVTKSRPMSILRNKHTPIVRTTKPTLSANADDEPIATPAVAKQSAQPVTTTIMKKPALRGGLLNITKPKKFVYAGKKSRSSLGGGLHRKFVTPKRGATLTVPNTTGRITSSVIRNRPPSSVKTVSVSSGRRNNVKMETLIQVHPSPLVPVWIGSSLDDDGLDDSVVNDLVMVMGEIVVEHCTSCRERNENGSDDADEEPTMVEDIEDDGQDAENDGSADKLQATAIKNVRDAALSIAATSAKTTESTCQTAKKRSFCGQCVCFLSARIVKNANGTDMNLQKESLRVRREYFIKRKKQMECLVQGMITNPAIYSVGCGPFVNDEATVGSI